MPTATESDVKAVITTDLSSSDIDDSLDYAEELNDEYNDTSQQTTTQTKNIERWAAVINIRQHKEAATDKESVGDVSMTFSGDELKQARSELASWLQRAGGDLSMVSSIMENTSRYTGSADP